MEWNDFYSRQEIKICNSFILFVCYVYVYFFVFRSIHRFEKPASYLASWLPFLQRHSTSSNCGYDIKMKTIGNDRHQADQYLGTGWNGIVCLVRGLDWKRKKERKEKERWNEGRMGGNEGREGKKEAGY